MSLSSSNDPRTVLLTAAAARGASLVGLSRMIGRNDAYLNQYVRRGTPKRLPERERRLLADFLAVRPVDLVEAGERPGPPDPDQVRQLASVLRAARFESGSSDTRLALRAVEWLKADGGLR